MNKVNERETKILWFVLNVILLSYPFGNHNHSLIYFLAGIICLFGFFHRNEVSCYSKNFYRVFVFFLIWGAIVTIFSKIPIESFRGLRIEIQLLLFCLGIALIKFNDSGIEKIIRIFVLISIINLILFIGEMMTFYNVIYWDWFNYIAGLGYSFLYTSSLCICIIVYSLFFDHNTKRKWILILINCVIAIGMRDNCFILVLIGVMAVYYLNYIKKISIYNVFIIAFLCIAIVFVALLVFKAKIHFFERMNIYHYWIPKILLSPVIGFGLTLKLLQTYMPSTYHIPNEYIALDPHIALHAHNILIDTILQQGLIGLTLFLWLFYELYKKLRDCRANCNPFVYMCLVILAKNLVDDQYEGAKTIIFWSFILITYLTSLSSNKNNQIDYES